MEPCKIRGTTNTSSHAQGLEGKEISSPSSRGRKMSLTSPLIDQALHKFAPFLRPFCPETVLLVEDHALWGASIVWAIVVSVHPPEAESIVKSALT